MKRCLLLVCLSALLLPAVASAEFRIRPLFSAEEKYTDNLFLDHDNQESDWITSLDPGLEFIYRNGWLDSSFQYHLNFLFYQDHTEFNATSLADTQRLLAAITLFPDRPFSLEVRDDYSQVSINERRVADTTDASFDPNNKINRNLLTVTPRLSLHFGPTWTTVFSCAYEDVRYQGGRGDDSKSYLPRIEVTKALSSRFSLLGEASYEWYNATNASDYEQMVLLGGFSYLLARNWDLTIKAGPSKVDYSSGNDSNLVVWDAALSYDNARWRMAFTSSRAVENTVENGSYVADMARAEVGYVGRLSTTAGIFLRKTDYLNIDQLDREIGSDLSFDYRLTARLTATTGVRYSRLKFKPENEDVNRYAFSAGMRYLLNHIILSLDWTYRQDDASFENNSYYNNEVFFRASLDL